MRLSPINLRLGPSRAARGGILPFLLGLATLAWACGAIQAATLSVGSQSALPDATVQLPVLLADASGATALQFDVVFDGATLAPGQPFLGTALASHVLVSHVLSENSLRVVIYSNSNAPLPDGALVALPFTVSAFAPLGSSVVSLGNALASTRTALRVAPLVLIDGAVTVVSSERPHLGLLSRSPSGDASFQLFGSPGVSYVIEGSSDLFAWRPLSTNLLVNSALLFTDPGLKLSPAYFYRAREGE